MTDTVFTIDGAAVSSQEFVEHMNRLVVQLAEAEADAAALAEGLREALNYVPEYFREKWDMDAPLKAHYARTGVSAPSP